jgi:hypothetical protein
MTSRWVVCRVCGQGFAARTAKQEVCDLRCFYRDPRRYIGYPMKLRQAVKHAQTRRSA